MRFHSIQFRLTSSVVAGLVLLVVVSLSAVAGLVRIDRHLQTITGKWLTGTQLLGELNNAVSQFRVVEGTRAVENSPPATMQADFLAQTYAGAVETLLQRYASLVDDPLVLDDLDTFRTKWTSYLAEHRRQTAAQAGTAPTMSVAYGSVLQKLYEQVQLTALTLTRDAKQAAEADARTAQRFTHRLVTVMIACAVLAVLLSALAVVLVTYQVARPLAAITLGLTRLAAGQHDAQVAKVTRRDEIGEITTAFEVFRSNALALTHARRNAEDLARHDALTGLPNRRVFGDQLFSAVSQAAQATRSGAVLLVDLDRFKPVNDLYGHAVGDGVLREIATRLKQVVDPRAVLARLGGDEFGIIAAGAVDKMEASNAAAAMSRRIIAALGEPIAVGSVSATVGASIGIAVFPDDGESPEQILHAADTAMYRSKQEGRDTFRFFRPSMDAELRAKAAFDEDLRVALDHDRITAHYQPIVELRTGRIAGFEALARWHCPRRGAVPPDVFIPCLERLGLLGKLTDLILRQGCRDAQGWSRQVDLAINICPAQLQDRALPGRMAAILRATGFPPARLEVEVTETALMGDLQAVRATLDALGDLGIRIALDDFGTGYSSLSHLRTLRFDKLKIDKSFVQTMRADQQSRFIVGAVLGLARNLKLPVVAEGIESPRDLMLLTRRRCEFGQGFLFSKAVPAETAGAMLDHDEHLAACLKRSA